MQSASKKQVGQGIIDREGQRLLASAIPPHWILREYRPDFGLDYALEVFAPANRDGKVATYETLGEHIFIQLKSTRCLAVNSLGICRRPNVEITQEASKGQSVIGHMDTARIQLETPELVTVERMGVGVPVLLVIADLEDQKCFFVCLNDYVDKILAPRQKDYRIQGSHTIHVPMANQLGPSTSHPLALNWYGKRPKLFAAFQRFHNQRTELGYLINERETEEVLDIASYMAKRVLTYDFWDEMNDWPEFMRIRDAVKSFLSDQVTGFNAPNEEAIKETLEDLEAEEQSDLIDHLQKLEITQLWDSLCQLSRLYEDVWREWYLPTPLGFLSSQSHSPSTSEAELLPLNRAARSAAAANDIETESRG